MIISVNSFASMWQKQTSTPNIQNINVVKKKPFTIDLHVGKESNNAKINKGYHQRSIFLPYQMFSC